MPDDTEARSGGTYIPNRIWLGIWASVTATLCVALVIGTIAFYQSTTERLTKLEARTASLEEHVKGQLRQQGAVLDQIYEIVNTAHPRK